MVLYSLLYFLTWIVLHILHPFSSVQGKNHIPEGGFMICANHSSASDPIWIDLALGRHSRVHIMAKKEILQWPVLGKICKKLGAYPVDRDGKDFNAIKTTLHYLKNGDRVLIFPEGTRVRTGKDINPKRGAVVLAERVGVPILPIYISRKKRLFSPVKVIIGPAIEPQCSKHPSQPELMNETIQLMEKIYSLGNETIPYTIKGEL